MLMTSCDAGMFELGGGEECVAEELTRYSANRGFVGIVAASAQALLEYAYPPNATPRTTQDYILKENYALLAHMQGESLLQTKIIKQSLNSYFTEDKTVYFNLLGDPALNLRSQGYSVSKNATLFPQATISDEVHVLSGVTLTIPNNCNVYFGKNGRLIIDQGAFISFEENASFHGMEMINAVEIRGGIKTKTGSLPNITFDAPLGKNCSGIVFDNATLDATFNKLTFTRAALFANSLNSLTLESPSTNRSTFNYSPLFLKCKSLSFSYCDFNNASSLFCYRLNNDGINAKIRNCNFSPTSTQPTNQMDMIYIGGYSSYDIQNNVIIFNCGDGISLYNSGAGSTKLIRNNSITFTGTSYLENNGIKVYNSNAIITTNIITNAKYGISSFSNLTKVVELNGNSAAIDPPHTQQIFNNTEYQVFSSDKSSFPKQFKYNYINNTSNKPLVYCAGTSIPAASLNVKCNNWGTGFTPSQDLYPFAAYTYLPIWTFNGTCIGKAQTADNTTNPIGMISVFKENLNLDNADTPENLTTLSEISDKIITSGNGLNTLQGFLSELIVNHEYDLLGLSAKSIKTQIDVSRGEYAIPINEAELRLDEAVSLTDSVYAAIELAQTMLQAGNGHMESNKYISKYQQKLPLDADCFYTYKARLIDLLYRGVVNLKEATNEDQFQVTISPNPATNFLTISFNKTQTGFINFKIIEPNGRIIFKSTNTAINDQVVLNLNGIPEGIYLISIQPNGKQRCTKQLVITK